MLAIFETLGLTLGRQVLKPLHQLLLSGALTMHNPPGQRYITISLSGTDIGIVLTGLLIFLISWIIQKGK